MIAEFAPTLVGVHGPVQTLVFALTCGGYGLLPDLDHPSSLATRRFSVASWVACQVVRPASRLAFRVTAGDRDDSRAHAHRGLTHTLAAAAVTGGGAAAAIGRWGTPAVWVVMFLGLAMAVKGLDAWIPGPPSLAAAAVLTWVGTGTLPWTHTASPATPWLGFAVATGMAVHDLGDACTESGAPLFAPLRIRGRSWYPVRPPAGWRLHTGRSGETVVLAGLSIALAVLAVHAVPGLWSTLAGHHLPELAHTAHAVRAGR